MSLNERITKVIEYSNLTSSEFADEIDVQRSSISHITSGRNKPSLEFIIKIKSRFPDIHWDWLVTGEGEMLKNKIPEKKVIEIKEPIVEKPKATSLPDLYSIINTDEDLEKEVELEENLDARESIIPEESESADKILNSQHLELNKEELMNHVIGNQTDKIRKIVIFYENGKFESFEP